MSTERWLDLFCRRYPDAPSLALWRANEAGAYAQVEIVAPALDVGCGTGHFARAAFPGPFDRGCDVSSRAVDSARRTGAYRDVDLADASALPYPAGSFRTVVSNCVLEHVRDIDGALREIARVLQPGGRLYFSVPSPRFNDWYCLRVAFREAGLDRAAERCLERFNEIQEHRNIMGREAWEGKLEASGMRLVSANEYLPRRAYRYFSILDTVWKAPLPGFGGVQRFMSRIARAGLGGLLGRFWSGVLRSLHRAAGGSGPGAGYFLAAERAA